jgi:hypothetical protein
MHWQPSKPIKQLKHQQQQQQKLLYCLIDDGQRCDVANKSVR